MSLFSNIIGGLTGYQITNPVAEQSLNAEQGIGKSVTGAQDAINSQIGTNTQNVQGQIDTNTKAIGQAGENVNTATGQANQTLQGLLSGVQGNLAPALQSGVQGNTALQQYQANAPKFTAPTAEDVAKTPGYQFQLQQGANAITNQAAAQGLSQGGKALTDLTQYGQGLAGTYYQNAFNNAQSAFNTNQNASLANIQALIGAGATANGQNLEAATGLGGQQATNTIGAANTNAGLQTSLAGINTPTQTTLAGQNLSGQQSLQNLILQGAEEQGNFATNYGEAQAGQNIGNSGAIHSGLTGLTSVAEQLHLL